MASVAEILLEQGRQAADSRRARGAMLGQSIAQIGSVPGQILEARDEARRRDAALQLQVQEAARRAASDKHVSERDDARLDLDRDKYRDEQDKRNHEIAVEEATKLAQGGYVPDHIQFWIQSRTGKLWSREEGAQLSKIAETPEGAKHVVDMLAKPPEAAKTRSITITNADGSKVERIVEDKPGQEFSSAPPPLPATKFTTRIVKGPNGRPMARNFTEEEMRTGVEEYEKPDAAAGDTTALTSAGLDVAALMYRTTGTMPALGMGDKTTRQKIINRAAELTPDDVTRIGAGTNIAANKANFGADSAALNALTKQRAAIAAFEQTAQKNIDLFLTQAGKVVDTGSPLANRLVRDVSGKLLGSPDQAAYDAARQVAVNEIAKITSNPTLSGQLSDSARHEVAAFNPNGATLKQTVAVLRLLKQDMGNRTKSLDDEIATIQKRLGGGGTSGADDAYSEYLKRTGGGGGR